MLLSIQVRPPHVPSSVPLRQVVTISILPFDSSHRLYAAGHKPGNFEQGMWHGHGTLRLASGEMYRGMWVENLRHGHGDQVYSCPDPALILFSVTYTTATVDSMIHSFSQIWCGRARYSGEYECNKRCGFGSMQYETGDQYVGEWHDDRRHGRGKFTYGDGKCIFGEWSHDSFVREEC